MAPYLSSFTLSLFPFLPRGARPLYRTRSLPQRDFPSYSSDYYPLEYDSRAYSISRTRRPYSNLGDYGYDQGINTYFGNGSYRDRNVRPTSSQSDYSFPELYHNNMVRDRVFDEILFWNHIFNHLLGEIRKRRANVVAIFMLNNTPIFAS